MVTLMLKEKKEIVKFNLLKSKALKPTYKITIPLDTNEFEILCQNLAYSFYKHDWTKYSLIKKKNITEFKNRGNKIIYNESGFTVTGLSPYKILYTYSQMMSVEDRLDFGADEMFLIWIGSKESYIKDKVLQKFSITE